MVILLLKLFLSAGHHHKAEGALFRLFGWKDGGRGYHFGKYSERDLVQPFVGYLEGSLKRQYNQGQFNADVIRVPSLPLSQKVKFINALCEPNDLAIDFHMDSYSEPRTGCVALVWLKEKGGQAWDLIKLYANQVGQRCLGVRQRRDLYFLRKTTCGAIVFELGFGTDLNFLDRMLRMPERLALSFEISLKRAYNLSPWTPPMPTKQGNGNA